MRGTVGISQTRVFLRLAVSPRDSCCTPGGGGCGDQSSPLSKHRRLPSDPAEPVPVTNLLSLPSAIFGFAPKRCRVNKINKRWQTPGPLNMGGRTYDGIGCFDGCCTGFCVLRRVYLACRNLHVAARISLPSNPPASSLLFQSLVANHVSEDKRKRDGSFMTLRGASQWMG